MARPTPTQPVLTKPRAALGLVRVSTDKQDASVADQREQIARWAAANGHEVAAIFEDEGVSGSRLDRPGLLALLAYAEKTRSGGTVVAWRRNRLARPDDPRDGLALERRIEKAGWRLHYLHGAQSTGNALVDTLTATIEHHEAGAFLRSLALDSVRGCKRAVLEHGRWRGPTPYGYAKSVTWPGGVTQLLPRSATQSTRGATVRLVPGEPVEVETIRYLFERYATGQVGFNALCLELIERQAPAPRGHAWKASGLQAILQSPVYLGHVAWNRRSFGKFAVLVGGEATPRQPGTTLKQRRSPDEWVVARDRHEPLVPAEVWERVQAILRDRGQAMGGCKRSVPFPLSGLVRCAACNGPFCVRTSTHAGGKRYRRYLCNGTDVARACRCFGIAVELLESAVLTRMAEVFQPYRASARLRELIVGQLCEGPKEGPDLSALDRQLAELDAKTKRAVLNMGEVEPDVARMIGDQIKQWRARADELRALRTTATAQATPDADPEARADRALSLLRDLERLTPNAPPEERRRFYEEVIEEVVLTFETRVVGRRTRHIPTGGKLVLRGPLGDVGVRLVNAGRTSTARTRGSTAWSPPIGSSTPRRR